MSLLQSDVAMRSEVKSRKKMLILIAFLTFDYRSIVLRRHSPSPSHSVSAFKKCKQKIVAIETKKVIPVPYPVPMLVKPKKKRRPQTIVVTVPQPVYKRSKSCGCKKHHYMPNIGYKCPFQNQQQPLLPFLPSIPFPTSVTNSITDAVSFLSF